MKVLKKSAKKIGIHFVARRRIISRFLCLFGIAIFYLVAVISPIPKTFESRIIDSTLIDSQEPDNEKHVHKSAYVSMYHDNDFGENVEVKNDLESQIETQRHKPRLFLHVGPMKTGTTSIQLNLLENMKLDKVWKSDNYQIIRDIGYRPFGRTIEECLEKEIRDCKHKYWDELSQIFEDAYNNATNSEIPINTIHSLETWSVLPHSEFMFSLLVTLFERWDVHVIMVYRPFLDWVQSLYFQYRKHFMLDGNSNIIKHFLVTTGEQSTIPDFIRVVIDENAPQHNSYRDILSTYEFYREVLQRLGLVEGEEQQKQIHIMQMKTKEGIENEFVCNILKADNMCQLIGKGGNDMAKRNIQRDLRYDADLVAVAAFEKGLVNVGRYEAGIAFEQKLRLGNLTISDLPHVCLTADEKHLLWERTLQSEIAFGAPFKSGSRISDLEQRLGKSLLKTDVFCSVNASDVVTENSEYLKLFDDCIFHAGEMAIDRTLHKKGVNLKWKELGCDTLT